MLLNVRTPRSRWHLRLNLRGKSGTFRGLEQPAAPWRARHGVHADAISRALSGARGGAWLRAWQPVVAHCPFPEAPTRRMEAELYTQLGCPATSARTTPGPTRGPRRGSRRGEPAADPGSAHLAPAEVRQAVSSAAACMRLYVVVISHCCGMSRRKAPARCPRSISDCTQRRIRSWTPRMRSAGSSRLGVLFRIRYLHQLRGPGAGARLRRRSGRRCRDRSGHSADMAQLGRTQPSADASETRNLWSRPVIRMILTSDALGDASRNGQPFCSA
jgi:hypothetical protein